MKKPPAILEPLLHRGAQHIKVTVPNQENATALVRQVPGRKWSRTHGCWYVPYTQDAYKQLRELFEVTVTGPPTKGAPVATAPLPGNVATLAAPPVPTDSIRPANPAAIRLELENAKRLKAFVPPQEKGWIEKIKTMPGRAWNQEGKYWSLPMVKSVIRQLRDWFGDRAMFSFDLPADMPEDYRPANWRQPQPTNETSTTLFVTQDISPELKQLLPAWMLNQAPDPPAPSAKPTKKQDEQTARATHDRVLVIRSQEDKSTVFLQVPAHRRDWIDFIKSFDGARWLPGEKLWTLPRTQENYDKCSAFFGDGLVVVQDPVKRTAKTEVNQWNAQPATSPANALFGSHVKMPPFVHHPNAQPTIGEITNHGKAINAVMGNKMTVNQLDGQWLAVFVPYDRQDWVEKVRTIPGRSWDVTKTCWRAPLSKETLRLLYQIAGENLVLGFSPPQDLPDRVVVQKPSKQPNTRTSLFYQLTEKQKAAVTALEKQLTIERKAYQTIKGYRNHFIQFLYFFKETLPSQISPGQIKEYIYQRIKNDNISNSTHSGIYSALQAFYVRVLEKPEKLAQLERPPKENKLPRDLDKDEIERMLRTITNIKHKCLLSIMYSSGLRVGELVRLRLEDIDFDAKTMFVFQSKNDKDRFTVMGSKIIPMVQAYLVEHKPQYWLFEGPDGEPYTVRSVQEVFKRAREKARIKKNVSTHALRHSYATHNLAKGIDLELLRNLMGHESLKTTQIYLHITKERLLGTPSPFDDLDI